MAHVKCLSLSVDIPASGDDLEMFKENFRN